MGGGWRIECWTSVCAGEAGLVTNVNGLKRVELLVRWDVGMDGSRSVALKSEWTST